METKDFTDEGLKEWIEIQSKCPYCPKRFHGSLSERQQLRIEHVKKEHPEKRLFKIQED